ncbi:MAG: AraC family transcriptional regulator [Ruminococcaceae bacterium]|nr:AraC family transcriptional regulator [Oscillospiraceae bacterium]
MQKYSFDIADIDFYLEYKKKPLQERFKKEHYHSAWEFYFYLGDNMTFFLNDTSYNIEKYDLVFVDKHLYHKTSYKNSEKERILIILKDSFFDLFNDKELIYKYLSNIKSIAALSFKDDLKKTIRDKFLRIAKLYEKNGEKDERLQIYFAELIATISEMIENNEVSVTKILKNKNAMVISQITNYINNHYTEKITLDFLSDRFFIDKFHLCHIFRKETGMTIIDFINQKRMVEAGILLKTTNMTIFDISNTVGFQNQNYFGTIFKRQFGVSPREYRQKG